MGRGGKREGAGRKPKPDAKSVITVSVSPQVAAYLKSTGNASGTVDDSIQRTKRFREWRSNQKQISRYEY